MADLNTKPGFVDGKFVKSGQGTTKPKEADAKKPAKKSDK